MAEKMFIDALKKAFKEDPTEKKPLSTTMADGNNLKGKGNSLQLEKK